MITDLGTLKINFFGENQILKKIYLTKEELYIFETISKKLKQSLHSAIIDPYFYHLLKNSIYTCIDDLKCDNVEWLLNTPVNQIEIWFRNKKIKKLKIDNLTEKLLFPLYQIREHNRLELDSPGIYIEQREIGMVGSYRVMIDEFDIDKLCFEILKSDNQIHLRGLIYDDKRLINRRKDALLTFVNSFEI